jgi:hypothetical protein
MFAVLPGTEHNSHNIGDETFETVPMRSPERPAGVVHVIMADALAHSDE